MVAERTVLDWLISISNTMIVVADSIMNFFMMPLWDLFGVILPDRPGSEIISILQKVLDLFPFINSITVFDAIIGAGLPTILVLNVIKWFKQLVLF